MKDWLFSALLIVSLICNMMLFVLAHDLSEALSGTLMDLGDKEASLGRCRERLTEDHTELLRAYACAKSDRASCVKFLRGM